MVTEISNFITEDERLLLLEELTSRLDSSKIVEEPFYIWDNIKVEDLDTLNPIYNKILDRQYKTIKLETGLSDLDLDYVGFAIQTKAFPYHADAVWPKNEEDRFWVGQVKTITNTTMVNGLETMLRIVSTLRYYI